jgi:putative phage-type endonuclease
MNTQLLKERRGLIGSSDSAAACGISPFSDPFKLYGRLRIELDGQEWSDPTAGDNQDAKNFGTMLEPLIAAEWERRHGRQLRAADAIYHPDFPWSVSHIDRLADDRVVELKCYESPYFNGERQWGIDGSDEIPPDIRCQVMSQMRNSGETLADVMVCFRGKGTFACYTVEFDQTLADLITAAESELYLRVLERKPPPPDFARPWTLRILQMLNPVRTKSFCFLENCDAYFEEFQKAKEQIAVWDQIKDASQAKIVAEMGETEIAKTLGGWRVKRGRNFLVTPPPTWNEQPIEVDNNGKTSDRAAGSAGHSEEV